MVADIPVKKRKQVVWFIHADTLFLHCSVVDCNLCIGIGRRPGGKVCRHNFLYHVLCFVSRLHRHIRGLQRQTKQATRIGKDERSRLGIAFENAGTGERIIRFFKACDPL